MIQVAFSTPATSQHLFLKYPGSISFEGNDSLTIQEKRFAGIPSLSRHYAAFRVKQPPTYLAFSWEKNQVGPISENERLMPLMEEDAPYALGKRYEIPILGAGSALTGVSLLVRKNESPLSAGQVASLNSNDLLAFDRSATRHYSAAAQTASDVLLYSSVAAPLLYLTKEKTRKDFGRIALMQAETFVVAFGITALTKTLVYRPRPYAYNAQVPLNDKLTLFGRESFFSGHVSITAAMSFFTATTFAHYYPDSKWKPVVWTYAIVWPAATGYFRYAAGKHYPTDILVGYVVGAATGLLIPKIHQKFTRKKQRIGYAF